MSFRLPKNLTTQLQTETGASQLEAQILAEHAAALGDHGRRVERAIRAWENSDSDNPLEQKQRLDDAVKAVYNFFIQREALGISNHDYPIQFYRITGPILARLGSQTKAL